MPVQSGLPVALACLAPCNEALGNWCQVLMHHASRVFCQDPRSNRTWQTQCKIMSQLLPAAEHHPTGIAGPEEDSPFGGANGLHGFIHTRSRDWQLAVFFRNWAKSREWNCPLGNPGALYLAPGVSFFGSISVLQIVLLTGAFLSSPECNSNQQRVI